MAEAFVKARLLAFLEAHLEGVQSEVLAGDALGMQGAHGVIADKVVLAAIDGDARFVRTASGGWTLKKPGQSQTLEMASFLCFGLIQSVAGADDAPVSLAGRRVQLRGEEALFPCVHVGIDGQSREALLSFAAFSEGAIPAAFRLPRFQSAMNRLGRMVLGRSFLKTGICLFRLGRRFFPKEDLPTLESLAEVMGLSFLTERGAEGDASLQGQVLLGLLEKCREQGIETVDALIADLYPDPMPVRFEAYTFDETYLKELPETPGVYVMRDREGQVIYVGKAVNLRTRMGSYFARRSERPEKTQRILDRIWSMEVETVGSELEALLLEARLIALCKPEFNTQVAVHDRGVDLGTLRNTVLVLPSDEPESVVLFCLAEHQPLTMLQVQQDLSNWDDVSKRLRNVFFENHGAANPLSEPDRAELEIARSWLAREQSEVNVVDVDAVGTPGEVLRVLSEYVQHCEGENWEKVAWRV